MIKVPSLICVLIWLTASPSVAGKPADVRAAPGAECVEGDTGLIQQLITSVETYNKAVGLLEKVTDRQLPSNVKIPMSILPALLKDVQDKTPSPLMSHTLEGIGKFGLKVLPTVVERLKDEGKLPASFKILPATFGLEEFVAGAASQFGRRQMGLQELTHYLDGFSKMTAATAGFLVAGGNPKGAQVGQAAADLAIHTFRGLTMPIIQEMYNSPVRQGMVKNWETLQETRMYYKQPVQRFSEMYPRSELAKVGFNEKTIAQLDHKADWTTAAKGENLLRTSLPRMNVHIDPPGGICLSSKQNYKEKPGLNQEIDRLEREAIEDGATKPSRTR